MDRRSEFLKKFQAEIAPLLLESVFKPGTASLHDHRDKGHGDLAEGIRTTMKIGDLELFGTPGVSPEESSVIADYEHFYKEKEMASLASLLPTMTVCGTEETKPGCYKLLYESEKSRLWAFLMMVGKMKEAALVGCEHQGHRCKKIVTALMETLPVVIVKLQAED